MVRPIIKFFDRFEDAIRSRLSKTPVLYGIIGGTGLVLFWRGVWHITDWLTRNMHPLDSGILSIVIGIIVLLATGLFVSFFIGDSILISGLRHEKKIIEKTEDELSREADVLHDIQSDVSRERAALWRIEGELSQLKDLLSKKRSDSSHS